MTSGCPRFPSFLPGLELPGILRSFLRTKFLDYPGVPDRAAILAACSHLALAGVWSGAPPGPRERSQETFYLYDPRCPALALPWTPQAPQPGSPGPPSLRSERTNVEWSKFRSVL